MAAVAAAVLGMNAAANPAVADSRTAATKTVTITASGCGVHPSCYKPAALTVQRSTKVVWKNMTPVPHDVMPCAEAACKVSPGTRTDKKFASPIINPNKTYTFTFRHPETYVYHCLWH